MLSVRLARGRVQSERPGVKRIVPQFDLPAMGEVFNLRIETATDGERVQREARERD